MHTNRGFTLIELIVIIVIVGILSAVAIPNFVSFSEDAQNAVTDGVGGAIASSYSMYYSACQIGEVPSLTCPEAAIVLMQPCTKIPTTIPLDPKSRIVHIGTFVHGATPVTPDGSDFKFKLNDRIYTWVNPDTGYEKVNGKTVGLKWIIENDKIGSTHQKDFYVPFLPDVCEP